MEAERWLAFALAALVMALVPGPGVMAIVGYAAAAGRRVALASVAGMALGNALAMTLSLLGVGALLAASATAFLVVKWAGALYLLGLGLWMLLRRPAEAAATGPPPVSARAAFVGNVAVGTFHPKTVIFFVAFVPQFIRADADYATQAAVLVATFCTVAAITDTAYALLAARAAGALRSPRARRRSRQAGGGVLIAAGLAVAARR